MCRWHGEKLCVTRLQKVKRPWMVSQSLVRDGGQSQWKQILQHLGFHCGLPTKHQPDPILLTFQGQMRLGSFRVEWPKALGLGAWRPKSLWTASLVTGHHTASHSGLARAPQSTPRCPVYPTMHILLSLAPTFWKLLG